MMHCTNHPNMYVEIIDRLYIDTDISLAKLLPGKVYQKTSKDSSSEGGIHSMRVQDSRPSYRVLERWDYAITAHFPCRHLTY
jgi:hypothetical protein